MSEGRIYKGNEIASDEERSCDVCVVGSGAGGGVIGHELAGRGLRVVMLEEGGHHTRKEFDLKESTAFLNLYQELGNRTTDDLSVQILQGRSVGGGTTINWCSTFRTPARILAHWREVHGVEGLSEEALRPHWDWLEARLHVAEWPLERMNRNNQILWEGLGKLGYHRGLIRRNVQGCAALGYCGMGCPINAKDSMLVSLIPDAVKAGLTLFANASARTLRLEGRRAVAVEADVLDPVTDRPSGKKLTIRARAIVVSAGALNSPALLLRSGVSGNGNVGRRTFFHPTLPSAAMFEDPVEAYYGAPQAVYSHHFLERGPDRMGFFLEVPPVHPLLAANTLNDFGDRHGELMTLLSNLQACIAILVDGLLPGDEGGTVRLRSGAYSRLHIDYPLTPRHWEAFRAANVEMARVQLQAGAKKVLSLHGPPVVVESERDLKRLEDAPWERIRVKVLTAHQMGGCSMGKDPARSVVDSRLRVHGMDNLFVVDGSVLPTALGVNPQGTIFGLARWGASHVVDSL